MTELRIFGKELLDTMDDIASCDLAQGARAAAAALTAPIYTR
jgi:hypothetical protein